MNARADGRGRVEGARIAALVREMSSAERALEELVAGEVDAVVDPISGAPLILRHAQEELRRSEARMHLLLGQVPAVVWTTDLSLRLTSAGGRALGEVDAQGGDLIGRRFADLAAEHEGLKSVLAAHEEALAGRHAPFEGVLGGRTFQGSVEPTYDRTGQVSGWR